MKKVRIDFVSDIVCPWCLVGLLGLEQAMQSLKHEIAVELVFQPFELNPHMAPEGENIVEHIGRKFGTPPAQSTASRKAISERVATLGFDMDPSDDRIVYNSFDAHRLLHWARIEGRQHALKTALMQAFWTDLANISDHEVLVQAAGDVGLNSDLAWTMLARGDYASEVRQSEQTWTSRGITSVPAVVINDRHLISGGQPPEIFQQSIRDIARQMPSE